MLNKKGTAIEEVRGFLTFIIGTVILLLVFYGCSVSKAKQEYEQFKFSKGDLQIVKDLDYFLNIPVEDKKMSDKIIDILQERSKGAFTLEELKGDIDPIVNGHIPNYRRLMILTPDGACCYYDSYSRYVRFIGYDNTPEAIAALPVAIEDKYEFFPIVMQYFVPAILEE